MLLREWMGKHGIDDDALGKRLGLHRSTVSRLRRGRQKPSIDLIERIDKITSGQVVANDFYNRAGKAA